jgi:hypothetical protein
MCIFSKHILHTLALEYAIRKVQENQEDLKLNGTCQHLVYADNITILGRSVHTTKKNTEALVVTSKEIGLKVNVEKSKYMVISLGQNAGQNYNINDR